MELEVQKYLLSGKTFEDLKNEFDITTNFHPEHRIAILNYDQIESNPKTHPIVKECRCLILHTHTFDLISRSFLRFFNWGEVAEDMKLFDFNSCYAQEKADGSLAHLFNYNDQWFVTTRNSWAQQHIADGIDQTWEQTFCTALGIQNLQELDKYLDKDLTYICELCSPYNKIVRQYNTSQVYLLTIFRGYTELDVQEVDDLYHFSYTFKNKLYRLFKRPDKYIFENIEEVQTFLKSQEELDPTFEGVVLRDKNNLRYKVKSSTYLGFSKLRGNNNIFLPKYIVPFVMAGNIQEILLYFPKIKESLEQVKQKINSAYRDLEDTWKAYHQIESQKDFALSIKNKTQFTNILFTLRKLYGKDQTLEQLKQAWRNNEEGIIKTLFK